MAVLRARSGRLRGQVTRGGSPGRRMVTRSVRFSSPSWRCPRSPMTCSLKGSTLGTTTTTARTSSGGTPRPGARPGSAVRTGNLKTASRFSRSKIRRESLEVQELQEVQEVQEVREEQEEVEI